MTAINALVVPGAAYSITDTALYDDLAIVHGFSTKVTTLPHLGMAISTSGAHAQHDAVVQGLWEFKSFDDFVDGGEVKLRELWDDGHFWLASRENDTEHFRLVVIGWSDRDKAAQLYVLCTEAQPAVKPFTLTAGPIALNPGVHPKRLEEAGLTVNGAPTGEPEEWLCRLIDLQRSKRVGPRGTPCTYEEPDAENGSYNIGGHAVLTKLTRHGITQRVVRRWPDRLHSEIEIEAREAAQ
jgi:hypothetical protein